MWWFKAGPERPIREQLIEARDAVRRQIEVLQAGPSSVGKGGGFIDNRPMIAQLSATLAEIEQNLVDLGPEEPV
jgi:hypothetical protein